MAHDASSPDDSMAGHAAAAAAAAGDGGKAAAAYEDTHVHAVYDAIAPHFSATRYRPWPRVARFLLELPAGSVGLDVGCGNGRYMAVNPAVHMLGSDRSEALVRLARESHSHPRAGSSDGSSSLNLGRDVHVADGLSLPFRSSSVDFAVCIAVVHHLSTPERRRDAVSALLDSVRPGGPVLVYVWALEQASSRRGYHDGCDQDTLVPWVMRGPRTKKPKEQKQSKGHGPSAQAEGGDTDTAGQPPAKPDADGPEGSTYHRYYHLYREGELEADVRAVGGRILDAGYEKDNWWVVCTRDEAGA